MLGPPLGQSLSWVHAELAPHYPSIGRPSIDPVLMIRMLIVGYVFAIRSERHAAAPHLRRTEPRPIRRTARPSSMRTFPEGYPKTSLGLLSA